MASVSPFMAELIEKAGLLEKASTRAPIQVETEPQQYGPYTIVYYRWIYATCFVKTSSFAPLRVNWNYYQGVPYEGDCVFFVQYTAYYQGSVVMPAMTLTDQWKKGMSYASGDLSKPYYVVEWSVAGSATGMYYDPSTGLLTMKIGSTSGSWDAYWYITMLTRNGADMTLFSPKPGVSHTITPKTKPDQIAGVQYDLRIAMKSFGIKSPGTRKGSAWQYAEWALEAPYWHVQGDTGMWVEQCDPYWWWYLSNSHPGPANGRAVWHQFNPPALDTRSLAVAPKAVFPPSSVALTYVKNDVLVAPNGFDGSKGYLYQAYVFISYMGRGFSFVTGDQPSFSGNPLDTQTYVDSLAANLWYYAAYPDYTCAFYCPP
jgi:hypothetical protein